MRNFILCYATKGFTLFSFFGNYGKTIFPKLNTQKLTVWYKFGVFTCWNVLRYHQLCAESLLVTFNGTENKGFKCCWRIQKSDVESETNFPVRIFLHRVLVVWTRGILLPVGSKTASIGKLGLVGLLCVTENTLTTKRTRSDNQEIPVCHFCFTGATLFHSYV